MSPDEQRDLIRSVDQHGRSGLLHAVRRSDFELAQVLLDHGANPNDTDKGGATALHCAVGRGSVEVSELLLRCCAEVGRADDDGTTPLMWATGSCVQLLLDAGAEPHTRSVADRTALMIASSRGDVGAVEKLASLPGTELNALDSKGVSAHAAALAADFEDVAEVLVRLGATPAPGSQAVRKVVGAEALLDAARRGDAVECETLLSQGDVDINLDVAGDTPLLVAAGLGAGRVVEVLVKARADVNHADPFLGETPLLRAVVGNVSNELLWMLLEARADPLRADLTGRVPAEIAAAWGHTSAADILRAAAEGRLSLGDMD